MTSIWPYHQRGDITIYHGSCHEVLPCLSMSDLVIADPPYGMSYQSSRRAIKHRRIAGDHALPLDLIWLAISRARAAAYVFCRWDNLAVMPRPKSVLAWIKDCHTAGDLQHEHGMQWEACCFYPQAEHKFIKRTPDVLYAAKTGNKHHPTEKPVALLEQLIAANVCSSVLDPFMGSGSTLLGERQE